MWVVSVSRLPNSLQSCHYTVTHQEILTILAGSYYHFSRDLLASRHIFLLYSPRTWFCSELCAVQSLLPGLQFLTKHLERVQTCELGQIELNMWTSTSTLCFCLSGAPLSSKAAWVEHYANSSWTLQKQPSLYKWLFSDRKLKLKNEWAIIKLFEVENDYYYF